MGKRDLRKEFSEILGRRLDNEPGEVALREIVAVYSIESGDGVCSRMVGTAGESGKYCTKPNYILHISGVARTGEDGTVEFQLSDYHCLGKKSFAAPAIVVATPRSRTAVLTTARASVADTAATDVRVRVSTFNPDGSALPNQVFSWTCQVPMFEIVP